MQEKEILIIVIVIVVAIILLNRKNEEENFRGGFPTPNRWRENFQDMPDYDGEQTVPLKDVATLLSNLNDQDRENYRVQWGKPGRENFRGGFPTPNRWRENFQDMPDYDGEQTVPVPLKDVAKLLSNLNDQDRENYRVQWGKPGRENFRRSRKWSENFQDMPNDDAEQTVPVPLKDVATLLSNLNDQDRENFRRSRKWSENFQDMPNDDAEQTVPLKDVVSLVRNLNDQDTEKFRARGGGGSKQGGGSSSWRENFRRRKWEENFQDMPDDDGEQTVPLKDVVSLVSNLNDQDTEKFRARGGGSKQGGGGSSWRENFRRRYWESKENFRGGFPTPNRWRENFLDMPNDDGEQTVPVPLKDVAKLLSNLNDQDRENYRVQWGKPGRENFRGGFPTPNRWRENFRGGFPTPNRWRENFQDMLNDDGEQTVPVPLKDVAKLLSNLNDQDRENYRVQWGKPGRENFRRRKWEENFQDMLNDDGEQTVPVPLKDVATLLSNLNDQDRENYRVKWGKPGRENFRRRKWEENFQDMSNDDAEQTVPIPLKDVATLLSNLNDQDRENFSFMKGFNDFMKGYIQVKHPARYRFMYKENFQDVPGDDGEQTVPVPLKDVVKLLSNLNDQDRENFSFMKGFNDFMKGYIQVKHPARYRLMYKENFQDVPGDDGEQTVPVPLKDVAKLLSNLNDQDRENFFLKRWVYHKND